MNARQVINSEPGLIGPRMQLRYIHRADASIIEFFRDLFRKDRLAIGSHQLGDRAAAAIGVDKTRHAQASVFVIARKNSPLPISMKLVEVAQPVLLETCRKMTHVACVEIVLDPP